MDTLIQADARKIEGDGTAEWRWQAWLESLAEPTLPRERWLPAAARLVVLAPHPDDELLACGGLMAIHARAGGTCLVVAATDGEASHRVPAAEPDGQAKFESDLAGLRRRESAEGLRRLGLAHCTTLRLGLADGRLQDQQGGLEKALQLVLRPDDVMVTTWRHDAHPDHEACGLAASRACATRGVRLLEAPVWMWHWSQPADAQVPWQRLQRLGLPPDVVACKAQALAAHRTQLEPRQAGMGPVLGPEMLRRVQRPNEYFFI